MNSNKINATKLKIKALSLAEESRIIRKLEKGCIDVYGFNSVYHHRIWDVRNESRATHLARSFFAGKNYRDIEKTRKPEKEYTFSIVKKRAISIIKKYSTNTLDTEEIENWFKNS